VADPAARSRDELAARLALAQLPGIGAARLRSLLAAFGTARSVFTTPVGALAAVPGIGRAAAAAIRGADPARGLGVLEALDRLGARALLPEDADFPPLLRHIPEPPTALFAWGDSGHWTRPAVAIVGSRDHSAYGAAAARFLAAGAAAAGVAVVSGMARGVDAVAQQAALDAGGASIGVLGNGFGVVYPAANRALYEHMVRAGCLVSELPPGERPRVHTFPRRNRLISGLALATVIVEARPGSGALITADTALEQGRSVLAVPGPITSATSVGCNRLIQQGARPCLGVGDMLEEIGVPGTAGSREQGAGSRLLGDGPAPGSRLAAPADLTDLQRALWDTLAAAPAHVDALGAAARASAGAVLTALTELELRGLVAQGPGMVFQIPHAR